MSTCRANSIPDHRAAICRARSKVGCRCDHDRKKARDGLTTESAVTKPPTRTRRKAGLRNLLRQPVQLVRFLLAVDVAHEVNRADFPAPALPAGLRTIEMTDEEDKSSCLLIVADPPTQFDELAILQKKCVG